MIKRPGNESYLRKMIVEECKAFSEILEIASQSSQTESESENNQAG